MLGTVLRLRVKRCLSSHPRLCPFLGLLWKPQTCQKTHGSVSVGGEAHLQSWQAWTLCLPEGTGVEPPLNL